MKQITIRKLSNQDEKQWQKLWQAYLKFYLTSRDKKIYQSTFKRLTDDDCLDCEGFVAQSDGKLVALVHLIYHPHLWQQEKICYLQDLFVDQAQRRKGIATKLIEFSHCHAKKKGLNGIYWLTHQSNVTARKLYDQLAVNSGFIKYVKN